VLVMLTTDGSEQAHQAIRQAVPLLPSGAELVLVTVIPPRINPNDDATGFAGSTVTPQEADELYTAERVGAHATLAAAAAELGPVPIRQVVLEGHPGEALCEAAARERAAILVVGSHGKGFLAKTVLGSVSSHVVRHAPCPVMVVRSVADSAA
jgi:nucleotide-binding universal stress UspA family protein